MKSVVVIIFAVALSALVTAEDNKTVLTDTGPKKPVQSIDAEVFERHLYQATGGRVTKPGTKVGSIVYVNAQRSAPREWLLLNASAFEQNMKITATVEDGTFAFPSPEVRGNASLFVVDEVTYPTLLAAPESRWVMVNVAPLKTGAGKKEPFFMARVQKELTRGLSLLVGAQNSQYPNTLMSCVTKPEQLDRFVTFSLPVDIPRRFPSYLVGYGIKPGVEANYVKACREGWAPNPTDDVQRVIWEKIHAAPEKPIKITYDKEKQKPVVK